MVVLVGVSEHVQESTFINGLNPEIQAVVRMMKPKGLREVMKLAQRVEERNAYNRGNGGNPWGGRSATSSPFQSSLSYEHGEPPGSYIHLAQPTHFKNNPGVMAKQPSPKPTN